MAHIAHLCHLARRFVGSLIASEVSDDDRNWVLSQLSEPEADVWTEMSTADQNHSLGVARGVVDELAANDRWDVVPQNEMVAAALLHDSGKTASNLNTLARVAATLVWAMAPDTKADEWAATKQGIRRRMGQYRLHPDIGARRLEALGSAAFVVGWVRDHHQPRSQWTIPVQAGDVLRRCDND